MEQTTFKSIINFAIEKEKEAAAFYDSAVSLSQRPQMKQVFQELAVEERKHEKILSQITEEQIEDYPTQPIQNLKISDYLVEVPFRPDMEYQEMLILAMKREEKSYNLYTNLANNATDEGMRKLFLTLANEEAKHKRRLETEYDDYVYKEN
ncbi:MAG: ferritin family protein [candidate division KSB1 bacterium]|nr:ferritin family protein [candidate division KSB1 bacterium]